MFLDVGHIEKCGFLHGVQHVSNITFQVFLGVFKSLKMDQIWFYLIEQASDMSNVTFETC